MIENEIICGDCLEVLKTMPENSIDLVITSPPYNKGFYRKDEEMAAGEKDNKIWRGADIKYQEFNDNLEPEIYEKNQNDILKELIRVLKPTGSIFYNHKYFFSEGKIIFPKHILNFDIRQIIIWNRKSIFNMSDRRFFPVYEFIFWLIKSKDYKFYKEKCLFRKDIWDINPKVDRQHPATFPYELAMNCIYAATDKNDVILDPYCGGGTTCLVAKKAGRKYIGIDISKTYCELTKKRLEKVKIL